MSLTSELVALKITHQWPIDSWKVWYAADTFPQKNQLQLTRDDMYVGNTPVGIQITSNFTKSHLFTACQDTGESPESSENYYFTSNTESRIHFCLNNSISIRRKEISNGITGRKHWEIGTRARSRQAGNRTRQRLTLATHLCNKTHRRLRHSKLWFLHILLTA